MAAKEVPTVTAGGLLGRLLGALAYSFLFVGGIVLYFATQSKQFLQIWRSWKPDGLGLGAHHTVIYVTGAIIFIVLGIVYSPAEDNPRNEAQKVEKKLL
jgi:hypothetical protein